MAHRTVVTLTDDIDGSDADRTVTFSLDGTDYEIELSHSNVTAIAAALEPFIAAARTTKKRPAAAAAAGGKSRNLADMRVWARDNGYTISDKGRVPEEIMTAYQQRT